MSKHAILLLAGVVAVFWVHNMPYQLSMTTVVPILSRSSTSEQDNLRNYPIVVGGLGDSGTRAVRSTLINLGVEMLPNRWVMSTSTDSILFINNMDNGRWRMRERQTGHKEKADIFETNSDGISVLEPDEAVRAAMKIQAFHTTAMAFRLDSTICEVYITGVVWSMIRTHWETNCGKV